MLWCFLCRCLSAINYSLPETRRSLLFFDKKLSPVVPFSYTEKNELKWNILIQSAGVIKQSEPFANPILPWALVQTWNLRSPPKDSPQTNDKWKGRPFAFALMKGHDRHAGSWNLYGGKFTLATRIKQNSLVIPSIEAAPQFIWKLTPLFIYKTTCRRLVG